MNLTQSNNPTRTTTRTPRKPDLFRGTLFTADRTRRERNMKMKMRINTMMAAVMLAISVASSAHADDVSSNFGPGDTFIINSGIGITGSQNQHRIRTDVDLLVLDVGRIICL